MLYTCIVTHWNNKQNVKDYLTEADKRENTRIVMPYWEKRHTRRVIKTETCLKRCGDAC